MVDCGTGIEHAVVSGCGDHVTNVDMELTAVLMGITRVPLGTSATVVTSSKYVLDCVGLLALGWKGGDSHLWQRLAHEVEQRYINWHHIEENDPSPNVIKARELALAAATTV
jgi:ribonuclease HI